MAKPASKTRKTKASPKRKRSGKPRVPSTLAAAVPARMDSEEILVSIPDERPRGRFRRAFRFFFGAR